jgi:hypothetical protein
VARIRNLVGVETVIPVVLVTVAIVVSLEPSIFGVAITDRQIILAFVGFLGVDALLERMGRLFRIEHKLNEVALRVAGPISAGEVLRSRASFERMGVLAGSATRSVLIVGVNLEGAVASLPELIDLARSHGTIRLLAMDPYGVALAPSAAMSGVDKEVRRQKIIQNLDLLNHELNAHLPQAARRRVSLQVADRIFPVGVIGLDIETRNGSLIVQHYLVETPAGRAPLIRLRRDEDNPWFDRYLAQCEACLKDAKDWKR